MYIRPAAANISLEVEMPTGGGGEAKQREIVSFQVLPTDERDHLDLDTGEIFQDYSYARIRNKHQSLIEAWLSVETASEHADYKHSAMLYMAGLQSEFDSVAARIYFTAYIAPPTFRQLADDVRNGLLPETITISFERDPLFGPTENRPLEYGWEPDGSGKVWHNKEPENRLIPITSIKFDYAILQPRRDLTTNQLLPMMPRIPPARMNEQIASIQLMLVEMSKNLRATAIGIIVLAVMIAIWVVRHL